MMVTLVFSRAATRWSHDHVVVRNAAYVALAHSRSSGLVIALVQPDSTLRSDGNSLFLFAKRPEWTRVAKMHASNEGDALEPHLSLADGTGSLSWITAISYAGGERRETRAVTGNLMSPRATRVTVDSAVGDASVALSQGRAPYLWAVDHRGPEGRQIRIVASTTGGTQVLTAIPNPYTGYFGATSVEGTEIWLAGPLLERDRVVTLLIRIGIQCPAPGRKG